MTQDTKYFMRKAEDETTQHSTSGHAVDPQNPRPDFEDFVGASQPMHDLYELLTKALPSSVPVLWPGNVRELRNAIERAVVLAEDGILDEDLLSPAMSRGAGAGGTSVSVLGSSGEGAASSPADALERAVGLSLAEASRRLTLATLGASGFNKTRTAEVLRVSVKTIDNELREWSRDGDGRAERAQRLSSRRLRAPAPPLARSRGTRKRARTAISSLSPPRARSRKEQDEVTGCAWTDGSGNLRNPMGARAWCRPDFAVRRTMAGTSTLEVM